MTENQIKEAISESFVKLIANKSGFKTETQEKDHGVDLRITKVNQRIQNGSIRFIDGDSFQVQLKATTEQEVVRKDGVITYKLEAKTYNDLIYKRNNGLTAMVLVVLILPTIDAEWVYCGQEALIVKRHAYWYLPGMGEQPTNNESKISIKLPETNILTLETFDHLMLKIIN